jgi:hypothetical protein
MARNLWLVLTDRAISKPVVELWPWHGAVSAELKLMRLHFVYALHFSDHPTLPTSITQPCSAHCTAPLLASRLAAAEWR